jgi:hypothetical protein
MHRFHPYAHRHHHHHKNRKIMNLGLDQARQQVQVKKSTSLLGSIHDLTIPILDISAVDTGLTALAAMAVSKGMGHGCASMKTIEYFLFLFFIASPLVHHLFGVETRMMKKLFRS